MIDNINIKIGDLELSNINKPLEICLWDINGTYKWVIALFRYNSEYDHYTIESCGDRLDEKRIDWVTFGILVKKGYEILLKKELEKHFCPTCGTDLHDKERGV